MDLLNKQRAQEKEKNMIKQKYEQEEKYRKLEKKWHITDL